MMLWPFAPGLVNVFLLKQNGNTRVVVDCRKSKTFYNLGFRPYECVKNAELICLNMRQGSVKYCALFSYQTKFMNYIVELLHSSLVSSSVVFNLKLDRFNWILFT